MREHGCVFATGTSGNPIFVGGESALATLAARTEDVSAVPATAGPFIAPFTGMLGMDGDLFDEACDGFNSGIYDQLFEWIPLFKEAGFSTFRFEDFIDPRVRRMLPSFRVLFMRAASPAMFGCSWEELPAKLGCESARELNQLYREHAAALRGVEAKATLPAPGIPNLPFKMPSFGGGSSSAATGTLEAALGTYARQRSRGGSAGTPSTVVDAVLLELPDASEAALGKELLLRVSSSVEQMAALLCNLMIQMQAHPATARVLAAEQTLALTGTNPEGAITSSVIAAMPLLDTALLETLRTQPPARPTPCVVDAPLLLGEVAIPAKSLLAPEPFVGHFEPKAFADPQTFDPARYARGEPLPTLGLAGPLGSHDTPGARLAVDMVKVAYVQIQRMFEEVLLPVQRAKPSGLQLYTVDEDVELRVQSKMYYELKRGVKKLKF